MNEIDLPDFEDMYKALSQINELNVAVKLINLEIEATEAEITKEATTNSKYFVSGKPPSSVYISKAFLHTGFDGKLLEKRQQLAKLEADIEYLKMRYDLDKTVIDVWRTQSANKRKAVD